MTRAAAPDERVNTGTSRGDFDVKPVRGGYRIHKAGAGRTIVHGSFSRAEAAALRLAEDHPDAAFVITREVARVERHQPRRRPPEPMPTPARPEKPKTDSGGAEAPLEKEVA